MSKISDTAKNYYDSNDADQFYHTIWGGEDIHVGIYEHPDDTILEASARTVQKMESLLPEITESTKILDMGAGYGGAARYLAKKYGCKVTCFNISEAENERNREKNKEAGLQDKVEVIQGNFEEMPFDDGEFDIVWSEDSFLHSGDKPACFKEANRVMKEGGEFIFTDPMQADDCPEGVLEPILKRIHLEEMGSFEKYRILAAENDLTPLNMLEMPDQLTNHYQAVYNQLVNHEDELEKVCSQEYLLNMKDGLLKWVDGGKKNYLNWGIVHLKK